MIEGKKGEQEIESSNQKNPKRDIRHTMINHAISWNGSTRS
jgi:hypothetical protein